MRFFLVLFGFIGSLSLGCPVDLFKTTEAVLKKTSPWPSVPFNDVRLGLRDEEAGKERLYLFGYSAEELQRAGIEARACEGIATLFSIQDPQAVLSAKVGIRRFTDEQGEHELEMSEQGGRTFYPKNWDPDFPDGSHLKLVDRAGRPLYVIDFAAWKQVPHPELQKHLGDRTLLVDIMLHELFHAYQAKHKPNNREENWEECLAEKAWERGLDQELREWDALFENPRGIDGAGVRNKVREILKRRVTGMKAGAVAKRCWESIERLESHEGAATFFGDRSIENVGLKRALEFRALWPDPKLSTENEAIFTDGAEYYYASGLFQARLLEKFAPAGWQKKVDERKPLAEVLRTFLD